MSLSCDLMAAAYKAAEEATDPGLMGRAQVFAILSLTAAVQEGHQQTYGNEGELRGYANRRQVHDPEPPTEKEESS